MSSLDADSAGNVSPTMKSTKDHVFRNWSEAAANAKKLMEQGEIDHEEYVKIMARAKKEGASAKKASRSDSHARGSRTALNENT